MNNRNSANFSSLSINTQDGAELRAADAVFRMLALSADARCPISRIPHPASFIPPLPHPQKEIKLFLTFPPTKVKYSYICAFGYLIISCRFSEHG